jgi:hypothetical protein
VSGDLAVDAGGIRAAAGQLARVADDFEAKVDGFVGELDGYGEPWGGDDIGLLIGVAHDAVLDAALDCFDSNVATMHTYAENLTAMAGNYDAVEDGNTESMSAIGADMPAYGG